MRALEIITGHVIYNPAFTYKFQLKTTIHCTKGFSFFKKGKSDKWHFSFSLSLKKHFADTALLALAVPLSFFPKLASST